MAIIALSNDSKFIQDIHNVYLEAGYSKYIRHAVDSLHIVAYEKKRKPEKNIMIFPEGDFIVAIGTLIFQNRPKSDSLESLYEVFDEEDIDSYRSNILGNYILAIRKRGAVCLFTDKYHTIPIYYYHKNSTFAASNSS